MTNQSTIDKLIEMHMTPMADAFRIQMKDPSMREVPFEDRFGMLIDIEYTARKNNRLKRLIKKADFDQPDASVAAIDYGHNRRLNRHLVERLASCEYITNFNNVIITGATGSGKTYLACALGMEACKHYYSVKYVRVPDMLIDLKAARDEGNFREVLKKFTNPTLLILDEWLLMKTTEEDSQNLFEVIHKRRKHVSTIFCSQYRESEWYEKLGGKDNPLTDAIMDRIAFDSYKLPIESADPAKDISMREVYGLDPSESQ
jgi:DNA replication protein DnaC